jgi:flagellar basal-body rod protein FlgG
LLDSLRLVGLKPGQHLQSLGAGLLAADAGQWSNDTPPNGVRGGHLEQSNVVPSQDMVSLMGITRHAEAMVRLLQAADEMAEKAIRRFGEGA